MAAAVLVAMHARRGWAHAPATSAPVTSGKLLWAMGSAAFAGVTVCAVAVALLVGRQSVARAAPASPGLASHPPPAPTVAPAARRHRSLDSMPDAVKAPLRLRRAVPGAEVILGRGRVGDHPMHRGVPGAAFDDSPLHRFIANDRPPRRSVAHGRATRRGVRVEHGPAVFLDEPAAASHPLLSPTLSLADYERERYAP